MPVAGRALAVLLLGALLLLAVREHRHRTANEARFGAIASSIAARDVSVRCPSFWKRLIDVSGNSGEVQFSADGRPADHADLSPGTCSALDRLVHAKARRDLDCLVETPRSCPASAARLANAVDTLAHESYHLAGFQSEAEAECYALQTAASVAGRLGATPKQRRALARYLVSRFTELPPDYQTSDCRNGGPLDLRPDSSSWP